MPPHVSGAIRGWHHGRIRAMRSASGRASLLTKLMPAILKALAGAADPDAAFAQFDRFLSSLPSGVQLFSLFLARPEFLDLLAQDRGLGAAPGRLIWRAIPPPWTRCWMPISCTRLPSRAAAGRRASRGSLHGSYEEMLDGARRFAREEIFRVGVQIVEGAAEAEQAGPALGRHRRNA